jgi:hypothetical protein
MLLTLGSSLHDLYNFQSIGLQTCTAHQNHGGSFSYIGRSSNILNRWVQDDEFGARGPFLSVLYCVQADQGIGVSIFTLTNSSTHILRMIHYSGGGGPITPSRMNGYWERSFVIGSGGITGAGAPFAPSSWHLPAYQLIWRQIPRMMLTSAARSSRREKK